MQEHILAIVAGGVLGAVVLWGFILYNFFYERAGASKLRTVNAATWFILAYGDGLDLGSYFYMTGKWWLNIVPFTFAVGSIFTFCYFIYKKRFGNIWHLFMFWRWNRNEVDPVDRICVVGDLSITVLWLVLANTDIDITIATDAWLSQFDAATVANIAYQMTALIAFVPMLHAQNQDREIEHPLPWLLWAFAFCGFVVLMTYEYEKWQELVYPLVNLVTHFLIGVAAVLAMCRTKLKWSF